MHSFLFLLFEALVGILQYSCTARAYACGERLRIGASDGRCASRRRYGVTCVPTFLSISSVFFLFRYFMPWLTYDSTEARQMDGYSKEWLLIGVSDSGGVQLERREGVVCVPIFHCENIQAAVRWRVDQLRCFFIATETFMCCAS